MLKRIATTAVVLALVACGTALAATQGGAKVTLHSTSKGKVLATSNGMTLYLYTADPKNKSTCTGGCASVWPPLKTSGKPVAGPGVNKMLLGQTSNHIVTYNHHPLYTYTGDGAAGQANGEGVNNFYVVTAAGKKK